MESNILGIQTTPLSLRECENYMDRLINGDINPSKMATKNTDYDLYPEIHKVLMDLEFRETREPIFKNIGNDRPFEVHHENEPIARFCALIRNYWLDAFLYQINNQGEWDAKPEGQFVVANWRNSSFLEKSILSSKERKGILNGSIHSYVEMDREMIANQADLIIALHLAQMEFLLNHGFGDFTHGATKTFEQCLHPFVGFQSGVNEFESMGLDILGFVTLKRAERDGSDEDFYVDTLVRWSTLLSELQTKEGRGAEAKQLQNMLHWLQLIVASQHIHLPLPTEVAFDKRTLKMHQDRFDDALFDVVQIGKKRLEINRGLAKLNRIRKTCRQMYTKDMAEDCTHLEDLIETIETGLLEGGSREEVAEQTSQPSNSIEGNQSPNFGVGQLQTGTLIPETYISSEPTLTESELAHEVRAKLISLVEVISKSVISNLSPIRALTKEDGNNDVPNFAAIEAFIAGKKELFDSLPTKTANRSFQWMAFGEAAEIYQVYFDGVVASWFHLVSIYFDKNLQRHFYQQGPNAYHIFDSTVRFCISRLKDSFEIDKRKRTLALVYNTVKTNTIEDHIARAEAYLGYNVISLHYLTQLVYGDIVQYGNHGWQQLFCSIFDPESYDVFVEHFMINNYLNATRKRLEREDDPKEFLPFFLSEIIDIVEHKKEKYRTYKEHLIGSEFSADIESATIVTLEYLGIRTYLPKNMRVESKILWQNKTPKLEQILEELTLYFINSHDSQTKIPEIDACLRSLTALEKAIATTKISPFLRLIHEVIAHLHSVRTTLELEGREMPIQKQSTKQLPIANVANPNHPFSNINQQFKIIISRPDLVALMANSIRHATSGAADRAFNNYLNNGATISCFDVNFNPKVDKGKPRLYYDLHSFADNFWYDYETELVHFVKKNSNNPNVIVVGETIPAAYKPKGGWYLRIEDQRRKAEKRRNQLRESG